MSENKSVVTVAIASIGVLALVCVALFWVAWSSLSTISQLREENNRLVLQGTVCKLRLESLTTEGYRPTRVPAASEGAMVTESVPAKTHESAVEKRALVAHGKSVDVPLTAAATHEPKAKVAFNKIKGFFKKDKTTSAPVKAENSEQEVSKSSAAPVAPEAKVAAPAALQSLPTAKTSNKPTSENTSAATRAKTEASQALATQEPNKASSVQSVKQSDKAVQPVSESTAQTSNLTRVEKNEAQALAAKAKSEVVNGVNSKRESAVSQSNEVPAGKYDGERPTLSALQAGKRVWALQAGAFKTRGGAKRAAKIVSGYLKEAELDYAVSVGKGSRDWLWKIYVAPSNVRQEVESVQRVFSQTIALPVLVARVPKTFARTLLN